MRDFVLKVRDAVRNKVSAGEVVDVEAYCRTLATEYPQFTHKEIEDAVIQVIAAYGGAGRWGGDPPN